MSDQSGRTPSPEQAWRCPHARSTNTSTARDTHLLPGDATRQERHVTAATVPPMPLDDITARELSRAARNVTTWTEKRNALIRDALAAGNGVREVARAAGLAPATVLNIQKPKERKQ